MLNVLGRAAARHWSLVIADPAMPGSLGLCRARRERELQQRCVEFVVTLGQQEQ
jgi:hypothetical protein